MEKKVINSIHQFIFTHRLKHRAVAENAGICRQSLSFILNFNHSPKFATICAVITSMQELAGATWEWPGTESK